jgi:Tfp pilus assembly protein PilO
MATTTMSAPQQSSKTSLLSLIIFIVVFVGAIFYVKPLWDDVSSLTLGRDDKLQQKTQLETQLQNLQSIQTSMSQSSEVSQQTALNAIPQRMEQDKLITDLTSIAKANDIVLNNVNFSINAANSDRIKRASVNANLTGDLGGLLSFLKGIEANPRKLSVKMVSIQTGSTDTGIPRVNFNVTMDTYYLERL